MASPQAPTGASNYTENQSNTGVTSTSVNKPSNLADDEGVQIQIDRPSAQGTITPDESGWTQERHVNYSGGSLVVFTRIASSEPSSWGFSWSVSSKVNISAQRITDTDGVADDAAATDTSGHPDPPEVTGLTSDDYLAVTAVGQEGEPSITSPSSSYTENGQIVTTGGPPGANSVLQVQHREFTGTSENPGAVTTDDTGEEWAAVTVIWSPVSVTLQYLYPDGDSLSGGWETAPTSGQNLYAQVDEETPSDTDYIHEDV